MRVFGLDFTSSPKKGKPLTLAVCSLSETRLTVERFCQFGSEELEPLADYDRWVKSEGRWEQEAEWIAGIDFPFGMPVASIARFDWSSKLAVASWHSYMRNLYEQFPSFDRFKEAVIGWHYPDEVSERNRPIKVQFKRVTDLVSHSQSPMRVDGIEHSRENAAVLPADAMRQFKRIFRVYFVRHGDTGVIDRMNQRTVSQIIDEFDESEEASANIITSGEIGGLKYTLSDPDQPSSEESGDQER